jgi:hypothetical protein
MQATSALRHLPLLALIDMQLLKTTASIALAGTLAMPAFGTPLFTRQAPANPCAGLGSGALSTLTGSFGLAALNTNLPNANTTGAPLVLFAGLSGHGYTENWVVVCLSALGN